MKYRKITCSCGQSLVEFIVVIPLFFIILSGIISVFYLQNRNYMDFEAKISLSLSSFLFEEQERRIGNWEEFEKKKDASLKSILDKSLNPSLAFSLATDKKDKVFLDKNFVQYNENKNCPSKNTYSYGAKNLGQFQFSTCVDKNGYERSGFSFAKILDKFPLSLLQSESVSIYYPFRELAWENRATLTTNASREFMMSLQMKPFEPLCSLPAYLGKINRAVKHGANTQLFACHGEMVLECAKTEALMPACIAEGVVEISESVKAGVAARHCPLVNKAIEASFNFVKGKGLYDSALNTAKEGGMRKNLL